MCQTTEVLAKIIIGQSSSPLSRISFVHARTDRPCLSAEAKGSSDLVPWPTLGQRTTGCFTRGAYYLYLNGHDRLGTVVTTSCSEQKTFESSVHHGVALWRISLLSASAASTPLGA